MAQGSWVAREQDFAGFEMAEAGMLLARPAPSPEPGGADGNGDVVAMVGMEARPGWVSFSNTGG